MTSKAAKFVSKLISKFIWLASIILILFVLVLSIFKVSLPYWLQQKESIVEYAENYIGGKIDYKSLRVDWSEFHPTIFIDDLQWTNDDKNIELLSKQNKIQLNVWQTLYHGDLVSNDIEISQVVLNLKQQGMLEKGSAQTVALEQIKSNLVVNLKQFLHQYIELSDVNIEFINEADGALNFSQKIPLLVYKQHENQQQLLLDTVGDLIKKGRLVIEAKGELLAADSQINYFTDLKNANLALLARQFDIGNLADFKKVNVRTWLNQTAEKLADGRIEISNDKSQEAHLDLKLNMKHDNNYYQIVSDAFTISILQDDGYQTHDSYLKLAHQTDNGSGNYRVETGVMPVGFLSKLALPLAKGALSDYLINLNPSGVIQHSTLVLSESENTLMPTDGVVVLKDLELNAYQQIPGLHLANVNLIGENGQWQLHTESRDFQLDWRPMLKEPLAVDELAIAASYDVSEKNIIHVESLRFKNTDAAVNARASLALGDEFDMTIYAEAENVDVSKLHYYWPRNPGLKPKALNYLDSSLVSGRVPFAKFIWQGEVAAFPFTQKDGQFDIQAQVENATFKFQPDWPAANGLYAKASFENEKIIINASQGKLLGANVHSASALLPDLKAKDEQLSIKIKADANYDSYKAIYLDSPLKEMLGEELIDINFDKTLDVDLELDFVLADKIEAKVNGVIDFNGNLISGIPYDIELTNTQGTLKFTENGAIGQDLKAQFLASPMALELRVKDFTDNGSLVQIDANGQIDLSAASKQLLGFSPLKTQGSSHFNVHYEVDDKDSANESFIIRSNLQGTAIQGPDWIAKTQGSPAELLTTLLKVDHRLNLRTLYKDQLSAQLNINTNAPEELVGLIKLGDLATQSFQMPETGVSIEGYFKEIDVDEWRNAFQIESSEQGQWPAWINSINITTPRLEFAGQEFTKVRINDVRNSEQEMRLNLHSEQARANVAYYRNGQKKLIIENLDLQLKPFKESGQEDNLVKLALEDYDKWSFECQLCKINGYEFGPITLSSRYLNGAIALEGNAFVSDQLSSNIVGTINNEQTSLDVSFSVPNPNGLLNFWQLEGEIRDTKTEANLNLIWPGRLLDFSLAQTSGHFKIESGKGSIKDLSDRKARIFSLFSLQSIPRRLSLDFSDIFRDGFFYDQIIGDFSIQNGVLVTEKAEIAGTAADVSVTGSINLNDQTVAQNVTVTPKLGSSLPVLAGWAIEPTTGVIMLIVSKLFEPALNVVSSIEYKISGPIEDPVVEEISKKSKEVQISDEQIEAQKKLIEDVSEQSDKTEDKESLGEPVQ
ncbi:MAG: TIGR02099 family protein [Gammaproteobacteria bacterium]|nr:TIGR02099 family protein [Gammaproteobacteria bacterium]